MFSFGPAPAAPFTASTAFSITAQHRRGAFCRAVAACVELSCRFSDLSSKLCHQRWNAQAVFLCTNLLQTGESAGRQDRMLSPSTEALQIIGWTGTEHSLGIGVEMQVCVSSDGTCNACMHSTEPLTDLRCSRASGCEVGSAVGAAWGPTPHCRVCVAFMTFAGPLRTRINKKTCL